MASNFITENNITLKFWKVRSPESVSVAELKESAGLRLRSRF